MQLLFYSIKCMCLTICDIYFSKSCYLLDWLCTFYSESRPDAFLLEINKLLKYIHKNYGINPGVFSSTLMNTLTQGCISAALFFSNYRMFYYNDKSEESDHA